MVNTKVLNVSDVNQYIKTLLESNSLLKNLLIQGELSNVKKSTSGHLYFSLKDFKSKLDCVMFKNAAKNLKFEPKEGQKITLRGGVGLYLPSGRYQITVRTMEPQGVGDLYQAFLVLRDRLDSEGYFEKEHKKPMPTIIGRVGIVTSPTGAAIQDIISIIKRRNPLVDIIIYPSLVQGEEASQSLIDGIETFNERKNVDVIILSRGGGSIEDLWAFNDERLAKVIYHSELPIISAVGHEIDFTISDFVADLRAPTPSAAAEILAEDMLIVMRDLKDIGSRMDLAVQLLIQKSRDDLMELEKRLKRFNIIEKINDHRMEVDRNEERINRAIMHSINDYRQRIINFKSRIEAMNPLNLLKKGYIFVKNEKGEAVKSIDSIEIHQRLELIFKDGKADVSIVSKEEDKRWQ